jgi:diguanylate cyclase (GGDEF)-like protein/PAS domain S-box-containing protein/putative nucleotidyltransferase with HDIG domain
MLPKAEKQTQNFLWQMAQERAQDVFSEKDDLQDILAELQRMSQELVESEERYRRIVRATSSFVFSVRIENEQEIATLYESGVDLVTGYTAKDHVADPALWHQMIHVEDRARVLQHIEALHEGKPLSIVEHRIHHKDGHMRWLRNTSITRRDAEGRLTGYDGMITDITELKMAEQQRDELLKSLRDMASSDVMTGLPNRRGFNEEMHRAWNMALRHKVSLGLLILDLDHFKSINDTYGHLIGDAILREYAALVRPLLRESDVVCRYAGDELVIILPWADREITEQIGERILDQIRQHTFSSDHLQLSLTASLGGHAALPVEGQATDVFINHADRALYRAKQSGRNQVCMSSAWNGKPLEVRDHPFLKGERHGVVLLLDNNAERIAAIETALATLSVETLIADTEAEAMEVANTEQGRVDLVMLNGICSEATAFDLVDRLHEQGEQIVPLWISEPKVADALSESIWERLPAQIGSPAWFACVRRALEHRRLLLENKRFEHHLEAMVEQKGRLLTKTLEQAEQSFEHSLEIMAHVISARERDTAKHCERVARMACILADEMGVSPQEREQIRCGALLHDIGKIGIPDSILLKQGPLNEAEWGVMQTHPHIGYKIVAGMPAFSPISDIVLSHQERYDGKGYPRGLKGTEICLGARIFAVVDAYDAMRSKRCYCDSVSVNDALEELVREKNKQFDPAVVDAFVRRHEELEASFSEYQ